MAVLFAASLAYGDDAPDAGAPPAVKWGAIKEPGAGATQAIGRYGGGCLDGARRLSVHGDGYFVTLPERNRVFGHPSLITTITNLGTRMLNAGLPPLPIGDLAQPRGGPAPSGHASHQTGLDVDIGYLAPDKTGKPPALVDLAKNVLSGKWRGEIVAKILKLVVADANVERLFVNPVIKRALCEASGDDKAWLHKVRPWWGHHDHFHVRLRCPADSPLCEAQAPLPDGDGCGELAWWFKKSEDHDKERKGYQARVGATAALPAPCTKLVEPVP